MTKQSTKLDFTPTTPVREVGETVTQQTDGDLPRGWQRKDNLIKETPPTPKAGRTKRHKVKTQLLNGFFQRESEERRKPKKKKVSKQSISYDSSSDEEGNKSQKAQIRNITKQSTKLDFTQRLQ